MARYRYTWKNDTNGWNYRIDILPYDDDLSDSITTLDAGTVISIGTLEQSFDELPIGLMDSPTFDVTLNFSRLPSALQTYLRGRFTPSASGDKPNTWLFWSDRGTAGGSYLLEFCGVQDNIESVEYTPNDSGEYEATYELVDALHWAMSHTSGEDVFGIVAVPTPQSATRYTNYYDVMRFNGVAGPLLTSGLWGTVGVKRADITRYACTSSFAYVMQQLYEGLTAKLSATLARTTNVGTIATLTAADLGLDLQTMIEKGVRFYSTDFTGERAKSTVLDSTTALLTTHVYIDGEVLGGICSSHDSYGWAQATAIIDIVKDLCETLGVKASYYPSYVASGSGDYIAYTWNISSPGDYDGDATATPTILLTRGTDYVSIVEGGATIGKVEVRYDLHSAKYDQDITEYEATDSRSRSTRSWNTEPILHNIPSYKPMQSAYDGAREDGLYQTNLIWHNTNGALEKAHEECRMTISNNMAIYYDTTFAEALPTDLPHDVSRQLSDDPTKQALVSGWLNTAQRQCSPVALAEGVLQMFKPATQTTIEVTYPLTYSANVLPSKFGTKHSLSGGPVDVFTHLPWAHAMIVGMSTDWTAGTNTISYVLADIT